MDNNTPPEDSIFSLPSYRASQFGSGSSQVQMNPATAMQQGQIKSTIQNIVRGVSVAVLVLAAIGGGTVYMLQQVQTTQASIDLKHAIMGTVGSVMYASSSFMLTDTKSEDPTIVSTNISEWAVQLPPGVSFIQEPKAELPTCYTITSLERNLTEALPVSCVNFLKPGDKAVIEYLIVKPETKVIITKKIIREE